MTPRAPTTGKRLVRAGASVLLLAGALSGAAPATAGPAAEDDAETFARTPAEDEVWTLYGDNRLLTARRKVEVLLEDDPQSIVGHFVLGQILREAEGELPQAMEHLGRARELYENKWSNPASAPAPWALHREILYAIQLLAGELERHAYRLQILDYYDSLYDPNLTAEHAWAAVQLGKFDEASEYGNKAAASGDPMQRSLGLNALCGIAGQGRDRQAWFDACTLAYDNAKQRAAGDSPFADPDAITPTTVHAFNAAQAALSVLDLQTAEQLATDGGRRIEFTAANPWQVLVDLYLRQGRTTDALEAARQMQAWRRKQPPAGRHQARADTEATFATLLLVAGQTERGLITIDRALAQPDRRGLTTATKAQTLGAHALLRRSLRRTQAGWLREQASWLGTLDAARAQRDAAAARLGAWEDAERVIAVLSDDEILVATFEPFTQRGIRPVPIWLLGDLVEVVDADIVAVALAQAKKRADLPELEPYFAALEAEVAWRDGDSEQAVVLAQSALARLPESEGLLRARVAAVAAESAHDEGAHENALSHWMTVMEIDGGVVRRLGLQLPARVDNAASGAAARAAAALLEGSPRLEDTDGGFRAVVEGSGFDLRACLQSPHGAVLFCVEPGPAVPAIALAPADGAAEDAPAPEDDARQVSARLAEAFHRRAFAMPMALSNVDLGSLDGSVNVAQEAAREQAHALLETLE